jgi:hypothetical protein
MDASQELSRAIDAKSLAFTSEFKHRLRDLSAIPDAALEWLTMEHYQFSFANKGLLEMAVSSTERLAEKGVAEELRRNLAEEDGHAPWYKEGMRLAGTDFDERIEFAPTTTFLKQVADVAGGPSSRALGALYATETAAIFEHEVFYEVCREICRRRGVTWEGSVIKGFHDIHLDGGVEQGHKDGLAMFVDWQAQTAGAGGEPIERSEVLGGALAAIRIMDAWWTALLEEIAQRWNWRPATTPDSARAMREGLAGAAAA